jgi:ADP-dependent NAD(P)H-hydrate dehydratase / NAD(P)H-hydrate epimerase
MKIFRPNQVRELEAYTIENEPIHLINLMERAANACIDWLTRRYQTDKEFKVFVGPGNNGGDGLAIARMLAERGYYVEVFVIKKLSTDGLRNYNRLISQDKAKVFTINSEDTFPIIHPYEIVIDALYGAGLNRPLDGVPALLVDYINEYAETIISIDVPSGLFPDENTQLEKEVFEDGQIGFKHVIKANYTLTFEFPKLSFFFSETNIHVGEWTILPIGLHKGFIDNEVVDNYYVDNNFIKPILIKRPKFSHKGTFGHALIVSGHQGKIGAAVLAANGSLRSGVGLLTAHIPQAGTIIMQTSVPECMLSIDENQNYSTSVKDISAYNAIAVGPAIGFAPETKALLLDLMKRAQAAKIRMVLDADALTILGENPEWFQYIPEGSILTPHPREFERLLGKTNDYYTRSLVQVEFAKKYKVYVLLKGAHTDVLGPEGICYFNATGNPGMATAGSGDVLCGVILSMLAQGYTSEHAAIIGMYMHGLAGDLAAEELSPEGLIASDIIAFLPDAFRITRKS